MEEHEWERQKVKAELCGEEVEDINPHIVTGRTGKVGVRFKVIMECFRNGAWMNRAIQALESGQRAACWCTYNRMNSR